MRYPCAVLNRRIDRQTDRQTKITSQYLRLEWRKGPARNLLQRNVLSLLHFLPPPPLVILLLALTYHARLRMIAFVRVERLLTSRSRAHAFGESPPLPGKEVKLKHAHDLIWRQL